MEDQLTVVGLCGSLRKGSYSRIAMQIALEGAEAYGAQTELLDLNEYELIFADGKRADADLPPDVVRLRNKVKAANGVLLSTPEYHASFSGVIKNALDLMGFDEFEGKMIGLIGVAGGRMGAINALNSLRMVGRSLHAWVLPNQVSIPQAWKLFKDGDLQDAEIRARLVGLGTDVAKYALLHQSRQALEFLESWEKLPENPGGED